MSDTKKEVSRTEYSARNTMVAMISRILTIVMGYVTRVIFTQTLSASYVGLSGLFSDILNVLALSELGIGTAITYALYLPIARGDIEKQKSLMRLFQRMYQVVAGVVAVAGLCVVPFMDLLVKDAEDVDHILLIYGLYLFNTVVSYLCIYKRTLIDACQLSYISVLYQMSLLMIQYILQIIVLKCTGNFILYLLMMVVCTITGNLLIARSATRRYPFLRDKNPKPLPKEEKKEIISNIGAMLMHKFGTVVVNNTDNILVSAMIGIKSVGIYANNYLIIGSVRQVLNQMFQGIAASVGNLGATEQKGRISEVFECCFFIGQWMYGFASVCLFELLGLFVEISFGESYVFSPGICFVLCLNFFVTGMRQSTIIFRDSMGLFWYDRYKAPVEAVINLVCSIILTLRFGIMGIFLGTFVSTMTTSFWVEPYVLYKKRLGMPLTGYFLRYGFYSVVVLGAGVLTDLACKMISGTLWQQFLWRIPVCVIIPNLVFLCCYASTREFGLLWEKFVRLWKKRGRSA